MAQLNGGALSMYIDCVSPFSWFGFTNAIRFRPLLNDHGVSVNINPFFLGAARDAIGNPYAPPPKAKLPFGRQDMEITARLLGLELRPPKDFPILSLFAVRVATWVKDHYPSDKFEATFFALASGYWSKGINIATAEGILEALHDVFPSAELKEILQNSVTPENKKRVIELTMESGAFGAPWIVGVNKAGEKKAWFGNDRWDQVFEHLGVPYTPVTITPLREVKTKL